MLEVFILKKNTKNFSILLILMLSLSVLISGCSPNSNKDNAIERGVEDTKEGLEVKQENDLTGDRNIVKDSDVVDRDDSGMRNDDLDDAKIKDEDLDVDSMNKRSKAISNKVAEIEGIKDANVVITGNTALVGIDIPKDTKDSRTTELKNAVQTMVKNSDNKIDNVVVTADADLTQRIKTVGNDVENGKPISGFGEEIKEIMKRITPNM